MRRVRMLRSTVQRYLRSIEPEVTVLDAYAHKCAKVAMDRTSDASVVDRLLWAGTYANERRKGLHLAFAVAAYARTPVGRA